MIMSYRDRLALASLWIITGDDHTEEGKKAGIFLNELKERIESYRISEERELTFASQATLKDVKCSVCLKTFQEECFAYPQ